MENSSNDKETKFSCSNLSRKAKIILIIFASIVLLVCIVVPLVLLSFHKVAATEMGLDFSTYESKVDRSTLYFKGSYMTGLGHHFIKFPITIQFIIFDTKEDSTYPPMKCYTKDALRLDVNISAQYTLKQNLVEVVNLFDKYGEKNYQNAYASFVKDVVCSAFSLYTSEEFFKNRSNIDRAISTDFNKFFSENSANFISFQLLDINIPINFNDVLIKTENRNLNIETAKFKQNLINTKLGGQKSLASNTLVQLVNEATNIQNRYQNVCETNSKKNLETLKQLKAPLLSLKTNLGFTNKDLIAYIFATDFTIFKDADENDSRSILNLKVPSPLECISDSSLPICK